MKKVSFLAMVVAFILCSYGHTLAKSTFDTVVEKGKLIAGVRFDNPPMGYIDKNNQNAGFEVDLVKAIAKKLNVGIELLQVTARTRIPMLQSGNIDLFAASCNHTKRRDEAIDFTITYYYGGVKLLAKKGSGIKNWRDAEGKTLAIVQGGTEAELLPKYFKTKPTFLTFQEKPQAVLAVKQGKALAFVSDDVGLYGFAKSDPEVEVVGNFIYKTYFGIGVRENDSKWRDAINFALIDLYKSGEFRELFKKHLERDLDFELEEWPTD